MRNLLAALLFAFLLIPPSARGEEKEKEAPWFVNVAKASGLTDVRAKDCIFTDLDGDGYLDLCLDRRRFYLSKNAGNSTNEIAVSSACVAAEVPFTPRLTVTFVPITERTNICSLSITIVMPA